MTEAKTFRAARRGRIFPEIQWTEERKLQKRAEREAFYQRCKPIFGYLGVEDALFFEVELIANGGLELAVDGMFDTGFSGWIAINDQDLDALGWTFLEQQTMRTANGDAKFDVYLGKVKIDGNEFDIPVHVGEDLTEVLIGRQWLKTIKLLVDLKVGILTLE